MTSDDPRAAWLAAQEAVFDEIRTYGRPKTGFFAGGDVLLLGTKGAKSGEHRVSQLTFTRDGERLVVVASKGGAPTNPAWFANLVANPIVTVESGAGARPPVRPACVDLSGLPRIRATDVAHHPGRRSRADLRPDAQGLSAHCSRRHALRRRALAHPVA